MTTRTFLITGASKGIGLAIAKRLSQRGHNVVGIARRTKDLSFPGELVSADLANDNETKSAIADLVQKYAFDGVVNNVGLVSTEPVGRIVLSSLDEVMRVNLHSAVTIVQAILPTCVRMVGAAS